MKNDRIRNAWDQVTPSEGQRNQMRSTLERRMETKVSDWAGNRNLDVQRIMPEKKRAPWLPVVAALALLLAGAVVLGWLRTARTETVPSMVAPTEETTLPTEEREAAFQSILDKYITAITEGWDSSRCAREDISILIPNVKSLDDLGYVYRDMNGDSQEELLITDGYVIYDMYALVQGESYHLLTGWERSSYFLSSGNLIGHIASSSAAVTQYEFLSYTERTLFQNHGVLRFDGERDPENPWLFQDSPVNAAMASYILDQRPYIYIRHTPFSGNVMESDTPEEESLLPLYAASIPKALENYGKDQPVTFCFYDYDGDRHREMILGAGKTYYAVLDIDGYTGEVQIKKPFAGEGTDSYFCQDGVLKIISYKDPFMTIAFSQKDGLYFKTFLNLMYEENSDTWTKHVWGEETVTLTKEEVEDILESYPHLNLDWQPLEDFPLEIPALPMDLFENAVVPIASGATDNQLSTLLLLGDIQEWSKKNNKVKIGNPADDSSSLDLVVAGEDGKEVIEQLVFTIYVSEIVRNVSVEFTPEGPEYRTYADRTGNGVKAESVEELRTFLRLDDKAMQPRILAEEFARAYFEGDIVSMGAMMENGLPKEIEAKAMGSETEIEKMTITYPPGSSYVSARIANVSIAFYEPGMTDSYTYLDLYLGYDEEKWFVTEFSLEK